MSRKGVFGQSMCPPVGINDMQFSPIITSLLAVAIVACSRQPSTTASEYPLAHHFDEIITRKLMDSFSATSRAYEFTQQEEPEGSTYRFDWNVHDPVDSTIHAYVEITIAPEGVFLSEEDYAQFRTAMINNGLLDDEPLPDTTARLAWSSGIGPNGGGETIVATTGDNKYDIRLIQSYHLNEIDNFKPPSMGHLAAAILESYAVMANERDAGGR